MSKKADDMMGNPETHPSYGMISVVHHHGSRKQALFGSPMEHSQVVCVRISRGVLRRGDLNYDTYYAGDRIVEVEMSHAQFAEFILSPNRGDGTPCTISRMDGESIEPPVFRDEKQLSEDHFKAKMKEVGSHCDAMQAKIAEIQAKKSPTKADISELNKLLFEIRRRFDDHMPWVLTTFQEAANNVVHQAKCDIEAFVGDRIRHAGLPSLDAPSLRALESPDSDD